MCTFRFVISVLYILWLLSKSGCNVNHDRLLTTVTVEIFLYYYSMTAGSQIAVTVRTSLPIHYIATDCGAGEVFHLKLLCILFYMDICFVLPVQDRGHAVWFQSAPWALVVKLFPGLGSIPYTFYVISDLGDLFSCQT